MNPFKLLLSLALLLGSPALMAQSTVKVNNSTKEVIDPPTFWAANADEAALAVQASAQAQGVVQVSGLDVTVLPFSTGPFTFAGGSVTALPNGTWYVGVDLYRLKVITLPRLGHRGWVPVARIVTNANAVTSLQAMRPVLPESRIPLTLTKMRKGQAINVVVMGSSLAEGSGTTTWSGMLFNSASSSAAYKIPSLGTFTNVGLGGAPNQYMMAQVGYASQHTTSNIPESGWPLLIGNRAPPNGRSSLYDNVDLVVLTCLANGGDYRLDFIEPIIRKLKQRGVEIILLSDNPQNPTNAYSTMITTPLYSDGPEPLRVAERYGIEFADTAAYVAEQHLRYGTGIYGDSIHMSGGTPAGPAVTQPSCGHEVYARAIRSLMPMASQAVGTVVNTYNFDSDAQGFTGYSAGTVSVSGGRLQIVKNTGTATQWGGWVPIPAVRSGDTIRIQGNYTKDNGYVGNDISIGTQGGGSGWGSTIASAPPGNFDVTITLNRDTITGGYLLLFGNNDNAAINSTISADNLTITVNSSYVLTGIDLIPGRPEVSLPLPPVRVVNDLKTPADAFVILPKDEIYYATNNPSRGTLGAHPNGANSFARRFLSSTGAAEDLLSLTTGQKLVLAGHGVVGYSLIRYATSTEPTVTVEVRRSSTLLKTLTLGTGYNREEYVTIFGPTEFNNGSPINSDSLELTVTGGTLKVCALIALTADMDWLSLQDITFVGTWAADSFAGMSGLYTDTVGSYATVRSTGRRLYWVMTNRSNSQPIDFYSDRMQSLAENTGGANHIRLRGGMLGGIGTKHTARLTAASGSSTAGNRSLLIGGAVIVNDR